MSIKIMSAVWDVEEFKGNQKLLLLCLADFANDDGICWPSLGTLATKCGLSKTTVKSQIKKLSEMNLLSIQHRKREKDPRNNDSNIYKINVQMIQKMIPTEGSGNPRADSDLGQNEALPRSKSDPDPSIDPPSNNIPPYSPPEQKTEKRKSKATPLPDDFQVTDEMRTWYSKQKNFVLDIQSSTEQWLDAMRSKGSKYVDWVSAWRNGMRNQNKWAKPASDRTNKINTVQQYSPDMDASQYQAPEGFRQGRE